jgi:hypothetical protein
MSQLMAETGKNPLHRPTSKVMAKNTTLKIRDARAKYSARLDDTVIFYTRYPVLYFEQKNVDAVFIQYVISLQGKNVII